MTFGDQEWAIRVRVQWESSVRYDVWGSGVGYKS